MEEIVRLVKRDPLRLEALECVRQLYLPQCYVAAGFLRNLVWDALHDKVEPTALNDVDVIFFDRSRTDSEYDRSLEVQLAGVMPELNWQVRNQARMHLQNGDQPYQSAIDAMKYWPEKETAVAIKKIDSGELECVSAFGFKSLFEGFVTHNKSRDREIFESRIRSKGWLAVWPKLRVSAVETTNW